MIRCHQLELIYTHHWLLRQQWSIEAASFASSATVVELAEVALENSLEVAALEVLMVRAVDTLVD